MGSGYANFDIAIVGPPEAYAVRVLASPAGQASAAFVNPFTPIELARFINAVGPPRVASRRLVPVEGRVTEVRAYGQRLADALFTGDVGTTFRESLAACVLDGSELRIRLRLEAVPDLDALPWEYLYDSGLERFLTLSKKTPVVRVLSVGRPCPAGHRDPAAPGARHDLESVGRWPGSTSNGKNACCASRPRTSWSQACWSSWWSPRPPWPTCSGPCSRTSTSSISSATAASTKAPRKACSLSSAKDDGAAHFVAGARLGTLLHDASASPARRPQRLRGCPHQQPRRLLRGGAGPGPPRPARRRGHAVRDLRPRGARLQPPVLLVPHPGPRHRGHPVRGPQGHGGLGRGFRVGHPRPAAVRDRAAVHRHPAAERGRGRRWSERGRVGAALLGRREPRPVALPGSSGRPRGGQERHRAAAPRAGGGRAAAVP